MDLTKMLKVLISRRALDAYPERIRLGWRDRLRGRQLCGETSSHRAEVRLSFRDLRGPGRRVRHPGEIGSIPDRPIDGRFPESPWQVLPGCAFLSRLPALLSGLHGQTTGFRGYRPRAHRRCDTARVSVQIIRSILPVDESVHA